MEKLDKKDHILLKLKIKQSFPGLFLAFAGGAVCPLLVTAADNTVNESLQILKILFCFINSVGAIPVFLLKKTAKVIRIGKTAAF